jgi:hypothetical protein
MITVQDLFNIIGGKISNEMGKTIIRNSFPPQIAEQMCNAIDCNEKAELLQKLREWQESQNKQQQAIQSFLQQYYNR